MNNQNQIFTTRSQRGTWYTRPMARGLAIAGVAAGLATGTWAVAETVKLENLGLRGLFATTVPDELSAEQFAKLDGNWATWSAGTAAAVADFYTKLDSADVAGQRKALGVLKNKLDVMQRALGDARYASLFEPLTVLHGRLAQRVAIAEAVLDTLDADPVAAKSKRVARAESNVSSSISALRSDLNKLPNGLMWLPYVKADVIEKGLGNSKAADATLAAAKAAKARISGRSEIADEKQRDFLGGPAFLSFEQALDQYISAVAWQPNPENDAEVRAQLKTLLDAVDSYAASRSSEDAGKIRAAFIAIRKVANDGGERISDVLTKYALNYNVRVLASEEFLNRLLSDNRTENGPVVDNVLGAAVSGNQTTNTIATVDLLPSSRTVRFDLVLNGTINSNTVGVTSEATVYTQGNHTFNARKEVGFDGKRFTTSPATINVFPHNTTTGIATNVGGLFSGIAQGIASQEVEKRRGAAEAIAADRIRTRVLPKFNSEVEHSFSEAGSKLESGLFGGLRATGLYPDAFTYQTTDTAVRMNSRLVAPDEAGANLPRFIAKPDTGATLMMHESAVNNAINRMELSGQTLTEPELREKVQAFLSKALSRPVKLSGPKEGTASKDAAADEKGPKAIIFAKEDPIRVGFENGSLTLILKAGFKQDEGKEDIPTREITVPINFEIKGDKIEITRGDIAVAAADGGGGGLQFNVVVRQKIESALPNRLIDAKVELKGPKKTVVALINSIKMVDGWVAVSVK